ncbi:MAG TPA: hypothetical protein V6D07_14780 [Trichocoleus sp.]
MSNLPKVPSFSPDSLPDYERKLLLALAFFLGREVTAQAVACLSMYLRQSEPRVMAQVKYYAHKATQQTGQPLSEYELLDLIAADPEKVAKLLQMGVVHAPGQSDVFDPMPEPGSNP